MNVIAVLAGILILFFLVFQYLMVFKMKIKKKENLLRHSPVNMRKL